MKKGFALVSLVLIFLFSMNLLELSAVELAGTNTGVAGDFPAIDGDTIVFSIYEGQVDMDLNGKGGKNDRIIFYF